MARHAVNCACAKAAAVPIRCAMMDMARQTACHRLASGRFRMHSSRAATTAAALPLPGSLQLPRVSLLIGKLYWHG